MGHSQNGTLEAGLQLQIQNGVEPRISGVWYHCSKEKELARFRDDHNVEWIFLTRSPGGGTTWGNRILEIVVVQSPSTFRLFPPDNKGDREAWHDGHGLPDWRMIVTPKDAVCLMITNRLHIADDAETLDLIRGSERYQSQRQSAIAAMKKKVE